MKLEHLFYPFWCSYPLQFANIGLQVRQVTQSGRDMGYGMKFNPILVSSVCEGAWFTRIGDCSVLKSIIKYFTPIIQLILSPMLNFISNLPRFSKNFISQANLAENLISLVFENIFGFCSSHRLNSKLTFKISIIHEKFTL